MPYTSLSACTELFWTKSHPEGRYELILDGQPLAWLQHGEYWNSESQAGFAGYQWSFRRPGAALGHTEIRQNDLPNPVATYKSHWGGGGTLTFSDGARFLVSCSGVWHHVWSLLDENGRTVLSVGPHSRRVLLSRPQGANLASEDHDRLLFLIVFLWHEILQARDEAELVAVMTATS